MDLFFAPGYSGNRSEYSFQKRSFGRWQEGGKREESGRVREKKRKKEKGKRKKERKGSILKESRFVLISPDEKLCNGAKCLDQWHLILFVIEGMLQKLGMEVSVHNLYYSFLLIWIKFAHHGCHERKGEGKVVT